MDKYKGTIKGINTLQGILSMPVVPSRNYQKKVVIPNKEKQIIRPDAGYDALQRVTVAAIPSNYGRISFNGYELKYWAIPHVAFLVSYRENKETWDRLLKAVKFIDKLDTKSTRPIAPAPIDVDYDYEPYQIDGLYKIFYSKNFLLCDDVGVGKSGQYIGYINLTNKIKGKINPKYLPNPENKTNADSQ